MSDQPDPERLLSEALRAQAVRAPRADPDSDPVLKLLSGTDQHGLLSGRASDTVGVPPVLERPTAQQYTPMPAVAPLSAWWIVLLAVLLGLAAGAVVGLVSVL
ncbi:MAG TPA: hypothetical protein VFX16_02390 [Pseudonocardiaceae bacterium]|nr:hypothetical protein [Pseudonocardiaceae bacterium]